MNSRARFPFWAPRRAATHALLVFAAAGAAALWPTASALGQTVQVSPGLWATRVPVQLRAPASATGEAVQFSGAGSITTRVSTDPQTGRKKLVALWNSTGILAMGLNSGTRYAPSGQEQLILRHLPQHSITLSLVLEPAPGGPAGALRTAVATLNLVVDAGSGAITAVTASDIRVQ